MEELFVSLDTAMVEAMTLVVVRVKVKLYSGTSQHGAKRGCSPR